ncbi:MAG: hypothetical protein J3R72DRAFT_495350 [Linnemannia gamsii]|nr:MAG: hypothetical protein J3R72DRAFT_495350 [Linnemannia gamsii]
MSSIHRDIYNNPETKGARRDDRHTLHQQQQQQQSYSSSSSSPSSSPPFPSMTSSFSYHHHNPRSGPDPSPSSVYPTPTTPSRPSPPRSHPHHPYHPVAHPSTHSPQQQQYQQQSRFYDAHGSHHGRREPDRHHHNSHSSGHRRSLPPPPHPYQDTRSAYSSPGHLHHGYIEGATSQARDDSHSLLASSCRPPACPASRSYNLHSNNEHRRPSYSQQSAAFSGPISSSSSSIHRRRSIVSSTSASASNSTSSHSPVLQPHPRPEAQASFKTDLEQLETYVAPKLREEEDGEDEHPKARFVTNNQTEAIGSNWKQLA